MPAKRNPIYHEHGLQILRALDRCGPKLHVERIMQLTGLTRQQIAAVMTARSYWLGRQGHYLWPRMAGMEVLAQSRQK